MVDIDKSDKPENPVKPEGSERTTLTVADGAELGHKPPQLDMDAPPVLSIDNLRMYFPVRSSGLVRRTIGHVQAVDGISIQVPKGGSLGLVGESGCGKSTTGRLVTRLYKPTGGSMMFEGHDLAQLSAREKIGRAHV